MCQTSPRREHDGRREIVAVGLQIDRKQRQRQQQQAAGDGQQDPGAGPDRGPRIIGGAMHQDRHREEQPHEIVLPRQRRGHRHQAEQDAELLGVGLLGPTRRRRHHREIAKPKRQRDREHDPVRRLEIEIDDVHVARRLDLERIVLGVVDRARQPVGHRDDRLVDPGPVLLVALAKTLLRARADHALIPGLQFRDIVLEAAERRRQHEQEHDEKHRPCSRPSSIACARPDRETPRPETP